MRTTYRILASIALLMGAHLAMAQSTDAATAAAVRQFSANPTYCTQFLATNDAGADGLDTAYSRALGEVLLISGDVDRGLTALHAACTGRVAAAGFGGVIGFYMHPAHCQTLTGAGPTDRDLMQQLNQKVSYRKLYETALASATDSLGGEPIQAVSELKDLCNIRSAGLPSGPSEF